MKDFLKFANSFQAVARLRLESITALLDILGNPQRKLEFIHIAGTNGKGSVCAFLQGIFTSAGYKTGKYTSPNLISVCERINIDGEDIREEEMKVLMENVQKAAETVAEELGEMPTPFEIWTAAAFCYFESQKCDMVILETGLGGTRDATNVIPAPKATVITRIALDHTEYLGDTLSQVATEKAGIIKKGSKVITIEQEKEAMIVLERACREKDCPLIVTKRAEPLRFTDIYETFSYRGIEITSGLGGENQIENASLAIETALALGIGEKHITAGIKKAVHKGRFEIVSKEPLIIFDGAHNNNGMNSLMASLKRYFPNKKTTFIMGVMADKSYGEMLDIIKDNGYEKIRCVKVKDNPRAEEAEILASKAKEKGFTAKAYQSIGDALKDPDDLTVICGSLYLYKDYIEKGLH
ncbi:MAG: bifunctional folylpolyglutamate synthase/dihydrofolate synthase [Clostridia bacterium]|nr:bifunctional folylpolyglutamate synthase/dihydrofolate synthase [Clostridia bacterium]